MAKHETRGRLKMKRLLTNSLCRLIATSLVATAACAGAGTASAQEKAAKATDADIQRGKYLVQTAGCNDCHTPGYPESAGKIDEKQWLTGSKLGWHGPWGTTYPPNLRLNVKGVTEEQWLKTARSEMRPPMPWFNLRDMTDRDLRAIYRYIKHLGPAGEPAPAYLPPGKEPNPPFVQFPAPPK